MSKGTAIGVIGVSRRNPGSFSAHHVELLRTFADQAVIAIENARLFNETQEALERQTATADILKVIASSPSDVQPVFEAIAEQSNHLLNGLATAVYSIVDDVAHLMSFTPVSPDADAYLKSMFPVPMAAVVWGEPVRKGELFTVAETQGESVPPRMREISRIRGWRSAIYAPLLHDGTLLGAISVTRREPGAFSDDHVQLLRTFADQAVIAIQNARLFNEVQARTRDLAELLEQQTATSEVLGVISRSVGQVEPVFQSMLANSMRICEAQCGAMFSYAGGAFRAVSCLDVAPDFESSCGRSACGDPKLGMGRAARTKQPVHVVDTVNDRAYTGQDPGRLAAVEIGSVRTFMIVPMLKGGELIGAMSLYRRDVRAYTDKQIKLVSTFADQAVIAIENARLFREVQQRTDDLSEALQQQTATADVLKVISRSTFDLDAVLTTLTQSAVSLCRAARGAVFLKDGEVLRVRANAGNSPEFIDFLTANPVAPTRKSVTGRTFLTGEITHLPDVMVDPEYDFGPAPEIGQFRAGLAVPLLRQGKVEWRVRAIKAGARQLYRPRNRTDPNLCRSGRDCHRECAVVQRGAGAYSGRAGIPAAADRHRRRTESHQSLDLRFADGIKHAAWVGGATLRRGLGKYLAPRGGRCLPHGRKFWTSGHGS